MSTPDTATSPMTPQDFDALDAILDDLRTRGEDVPQWEFCEGAIAALVCTRRAVEPDEYLPLVLGVDETLSLTDAIEAAAPSFADASQRQRFMALWQRRWAEVVLALDTDVQTLEDDRAYHPEVMDVRGAVADLPEDARADLTGHELPSFAQVWALGFMFVVENWPEEWEAPRHAEAAEMLEQALEAVVALTEDDTDPPTVCMHREDGPPSVSDARLNAFGAAIWAVYDLRQVWRSLGPRLAPVRQTAKAGRNDPCPCGSGLKYKKCHGA